jgi:hypothetical protein
MELKNNEEKCVNCHNHFEMFRPSVKEIIVLKHFKRDYPDFDTTLVTDSKHEHFVKLHKFEESIEGNHIFRAIHRRKHLVYAIDKQNRIIFLRAFDNFGLYKKFLEEKRQILDMIGRA